MRAEGRLRTQPRYYRNPRQQMLACNTDSADFLLLLKRQLLVAEEDYQMIEKRLANVAKVVIA